MDLLERLEKFTSKVDADVAIANNGADWLVSITWGQEAPDSPMAGAQALGCDASLSVALEQALTEARA
jgi:hypothetical protein